jgi:hypothetical protein
MKPLTIIYIIRVFLGIVAAAIAAFTVSLSGGNPLMNGITVALATYLVTYYLLKWKFTPKVDQQSKILTMGIGIYFMMFYRVLGTDYHTILGDTRCTVHL